MAKALNLIPNSIFPPFLSPTIPKRKFCTIRATTESSDTPQASASVQTKPEPSSPPLTFAPPPNFKPPEPKRFGVRPDKVWDVLGAALALFFRLGTGVFVSGYSFSFVSKNDIPPDQYALEFNDSKVKETSKVGPRPAKPIEIYEFEGCPFCRKMNTFSASLLPGQLRDPFNCQDFGQICASMALKVREIIAVLDLDVLFYPCPQGGPNFRRKVAEMGGKQQFPYMVDPNTGVSMYESDHIIKYLVGKYGDGTVPLALSLGLLTTLTAGFAMIGRAGKGSRYSPSKLPSKPLLVWAYEGSPFCKLVREVLVELELPHIYRSCARGSPKRQILFEKTGRFQAPYLEDPNTGVEMFESAEIVEYLKATYALQ